MSFDEAFMRFSKNNYALIHEPVRCEGLLKKQAFIVQLNFHAKMGGGLLYE